MIPNLQSFAALLESMDIRSCAAASEASDLGVGQKWRDEDGLCLHVGHLRPALFFGLRELFLGCVSRPTTEPPRQGAKQLFAAP